MKGNYKKRKFCRFCGSKDLVKFLDLGSMPHAGDFLMANEVGREKYYPLRIYFCKKCKLVQILDIISPDTLFKDYHYLSSVSLSEHFKKYADEIGKKFLTKNSFVIEIGSNDGVLLFPLKKKGIRVLGVDPAENVVNIANKKGVETLTMYFNKKTSENILQKYGQADVVLANNVLAHIDDMNDAFLGIKNILNTDGVLIFEVHYFPDLIKKLQYDFFYNEHLSYYSLNSLIPFLNKFDLEIFDVKKNLIHSGSIRVYAKLKNNTKYKIKKSVLKFLSSEDKFISLKSLNIFSRKVYEHKNKLKEIILNIKSNGNRIVGYGASGRGNTLLNFLELDNKILDYIVDESPERQNKFTPGTHIPIVSPKFFRNDDVKYALLLAWNYQKEIGKKEEKFIKMGGKFIIPLPQIHEI